VERKIDGIRARARVGFIEKEVDLERNCTAIEAELPTLSMGGGTCCSA
jgi:hypothetical protein